MRSLALAWITLLSAALTAQQGGSLRPAGSIPLPNVHGRIDHMSFDPQGRLFVSALGNNSLEVVDVVNRKLDHTITGVPHPQGVLYCADVNKLFVGSDEGKLYIYDATSFRLITSIDFGDDVDNLRYDPSAKRVYVGYGGQGTGAIAMVDAASNQRLPTEFKLGAHPESFQLETSGANLYVNVPDLKQIASVNRSTGAILRWKLSFERNFPMALDEAGHRLFVAARSPARLLVYDTASGRMLASLPCVGDSDDLFFDRARKRIYAVGGEGFINVFQQDNPDQYRLLAKIPTQPGARTAGYFGKSSNGSDLFYVAAPARGSAPAAILIFSAGD